MKTTVSKSEFRTAFKTMGRGDQFSYQGLGELFEYLEQYEEGCDEEIELDVIALCCDWSEYDDIEEFNDCQGTEFEDWEEVQEETSVILVGEGAIVQCY